MGSGEVQISDCWHDGDIKAVPSLLCLRSSEREREKGYWQWHSERPCTSTDTKTNTNANRGTKTIWTSSAYMCVCMCVMNGSARECVCQSYHREHSSPKPASDSWHLYPGSLPASPKTHHPSKSPWSGGRSHIGASSRCAWILYTHTHTHKHTQIQDNPQRLKVWLICLFHSESWTCRQKSYWEITCY